MSHLRSAFAAFGAALDYKRHDPRGWMGDPSRGAAVGRPTITDAPAGTSIELHVRRAHLDSGGYDSNGTYFGRGAPLYHVSGEDAEGNDVDFVVRAYDREDAREKALRKYPNARIRR